MPRKPGSADSPPEEGKKPAAKAPRRAGKIASPDDVKVVGGRITKSAAKKPPAAKAKPASKQAEKPAKPTAKKPAAKRPRKTGTTLIPNPAKLPKRQQKALEAASLQELDPRQAKFVDLWLMTANATQSYIDAGYQVKNDQVAAAAASRLLKKVKDHPYTLARRAALIADTTEVQNRVLTAIFDAAMADPRELVEFRYFCCRFCHGKDFKYQFTPNGMRKRRQEYEQLAAEARESKQPVPEFDEEGGEGFHKFNLPHENCPECSGQGVPQLIIKDTAHLSPAAVRLFGGVKQGKDGLEMKVNDQKPYLEMLARLYNMDVDPPPPPAAVGVTTEQLNEILSKARENTDRQRKGMADRAARLEKVFEEHGEPGGATVAGAAG